MNKTDIKEANHTFSLHNVSEQMGSTQIYLTFSKFTYQLISNLITVFLLSNISMVLFYPHSLEMS